MPSHVKVAGFMLYGRPAAEDEFAYPITIEGEDEQGSQRIFREVDKVVEAYQEIVTNAALKWDESDVWAVPVQIDKDGSLVMPSYVHVGKKKPEVEAGLPETEVEAT